MGDRTQEFKNFVRSYTDNDRVTSVAAPSNVDSSQFTRVTRELGDRLNDMRLQMAELERLAGRSGMFDDRSSTIQIISHELRQSMVALTARLDAVERENLDYVGNAQHDKAYHKAVIQTLRNRLGELMRDLKNVLERRTAAMRRLAERKMNYSAGTKFIREEELAMPADPDADLESGGLITQQTRQQPTTIYQTARAEAVESMQRLIGELGQIFTRIATLVSTQEELTVRIEDDVSSALENVQRGEAHLVKYLQRVSSNRGLLLKVFAILSAFIVFFVLFLA